MPIPTTMNAVVLHDADDMRSRNVRSRSSAPARSC